MAKNSAYLARQQAYMLRREEEVRHHARVFQLDMVTIALGRMGWRERKFREFDKALSEVYDTYCKKIIDDSKDDPEIWYSKAKIDQEIQQYVGELFVPYDKRYE